MKEYPQNQREIIENPEKKMFVFINGCLVFNKSTKLLNGEKIVFSTNVLEHLGIHMQSSKPWYIFLFLKFYFIFKLYNIVLVLPNIEMNPPQVYPRSPSWTLLPPPAPPLWVIPVHQPQASSTVHWTWTGDSFHTWYYTGFNAILLNLPTLSLSHRVHKTDLYISVSFAVSHTGLSLPSF